jgi:hypothetical protein
MSKQLPPVITSAQYKALCAKHGFDQAEAGTRELLNEMLVESLDQMTRQAILQADHEKHTKLSRSNAVKAVEMTPDMPKGIY